MKENIGKIVRVATVAPIMALVLLLAGYFEGELWTFKEAVLAALFLTLLPLLAYPLQPVIPKYKEMGREGQRSLAIVFAVVGYVAGIVFCFAADVERKLSLVFWTYLLSGVLIFLSSKALHFKASGHACGIAGPMVLAMAFGLKIWWLYAPLFVLVMLISVKMKRHSYAQFIIGGIIPIVVAVLLLMVYNTL